MSILPFYSQKRDFLGRSLDLNLLHSKSGLQKDLDYVLPFLTSFLCCVPPCDDVINVGVPEPHPFAVQSGSVQGK